MMQTRRDFMSTAAVGTAGLALSGNIGNVPAIAQPAAPSAAKARATIDQVAKADVDKFIASLTGGGVRKGDANYEAVRLVWNGKFEKLPGLIALCKGSADVARTIEF